MPAKSESPNGVEFMQMVAEALGVDISTTEGVKATARATRKPLRYIYRWRSGESGISLANAIEMLKAAKLLRPPAEAAGEPTNAHQILEGLVAAVAELTSSHRAALADLQDVRTRLARAEVGFSSVWSRDQEGGQAMNGFARNTSALFWSSVAHPFVSPSPVCRTSRACNAFNLIAAKGSRVERGVLR